MLYNPSVQDLMGSVKAVTVKQPWAYAIFYLGKDTENRGWIPGYKGRLYIHAGNSWDSEGEAWIESEGLTIDYSKIVFGSVLGCVDMDVATSRSRWAMPDHFHWTLSNPRLLSEPFPAKGQLGLWQCDLASLQKQACISAYWGELPRQYLDEFQGMEGEAVYKGWNIYLSEPNGGIIGVAIRKGDRLYTLDSESATDEYVYHDREWHVQQAKFKIDRLILDAKAKKLARDRARPQVIATQLSLFGGS